MKNLKEKKQSLEGSIKILSELTQQDLKQSKKKTYADSSEYHPFFDWNSWTFINKKIA